MTIDGERLSDQMKRSRVRDGKFERLVNDEWVEWPVLTLDGLGTDEARRIAARSQPRSEP